MTPTQHAVLTAVLIVWTGLMLALAFTFGRQAIHERRATPDPEPEPLPCSVPHSVWVAADHVIEVVRTVDDWKITRWTARPDGSWRRSSGRFTDRRQMRTYLRMTMSEDR